MTHWSVMQLQKALHREGREETLLGFEVLRECSRLLAALLRELRVYFADFAVKSFCSVSLL
jgi:hypothetical protein